MAGLSVLLETQKGLNKSPQIISKVNLHSSSLHRSPPPPPSPPLLTTPFLEKCYLCRKRLPEGKDIYMYRGNRAFCSVECRCRQIVMDEESGRRDNCSVATATATATAAALSPHHRDTVAGRAGR